MAITVLTNKTTHDAAVAKAESGSPTVIYLSFEPSPICRAFTPGYARLADERAGGITFCQMEYEKDTSPMFKFGPQHAPLVVMIRGNRCQTLCQPSVGAVTDAVDGFFGKA